MKAKTSFILLTRHTDEEITDFIQAKAEAGWRLVSAKGNRFRFSERKYDGRRLSALSFLAKDPSVPTENQLRTELPILRKDGWDVISIGGPENIADTRRHVFLYEEHPAEKRPDSDPDLEAKSRKRGRRKASSNFLIAIIYLIFLSVLLSSDAVRITSSNAFIIFYAVFFLMIASCLFLSIRSLLSIAEERKNHKKYMEKKLYRFLDYATAAISASLLVFAIFIAFDFLYGNPERGEKITIGGETVTLYSQSLPITLVSLGLPAEGEHRTSIYRESHSAAASYRYSYEQYLGQGASFSFLSCTAYKSDISLLRSIALRQLCMAPVHHSGRIGDWNMLVSESGLETVLLGDSSILYIRSASRLSEGNIVAIADAMMDF